MHDESLLIAERAAGGAINHRLRHATRQRTDTRVTEKDFIFRYGKFVLAKFLVRQDFGQSHVVKLAENKNRQSGKIRLAGWLENKSSNGFVEAGLQITFALGPDHLFGDLTVLDDEQGWNRADTKLSGESLMLVNVDLADFDFALKFRGEFVQHGRNHFARSTPFGPEIHEHGRGGLECFSIKIILREGNN